MKHPSSIPVRAHSFPLVCLLAAPALCTALAASTPPPSPSASASADATRISLHAIIPGDASQSLVILHTQSEQAVTLTDADTFAGKARLKISARHGETSLVSFRLAGAALPTAVTLAPAGSVREWALRAAPDGARFIDLHLAAPLKKDATLNLALDFTAPLPTSDKPAANGSRSLPFPILSAGDATHTLDGTLDVAWSQKLALVHADTQNLTATGPADSLRPFTAGHKARFRLGPSPSLRLVLMPSQSMAELHNLTLRGDLQAGGRFGFVLEATARARVDGAVLPLLAGDAGLRTPGSSNDYRVRATQTTPTGDAPPLRYELVFPQAGEFPVRLEFDARVIRTDDWRRVDFVLPAARMATLSLGGFPEQTKFLTTAMPPLAPDPAAAGRFGGHLAADGAVAFSWMTASADTDARLFYSTEEISEIVVSPGLLRQTSAHTYKILQGRLDTFRIALAGDGEILRVTAPDILSWNVENDPAAAAPGRLLLVRLSQSVTTAATLTIETQTPLGDFPARFAPLSLTPLGGVRHSGFVRVGNAGAVRLESTPRAGLTQVAPALFPDAPSSPADDGSQTFVYRISGDNSAMEIQAGNILPETSVSALLTYTVGASDLALDADLELNVREAPLRELVLHVPQGFAVNNAASGPELVAGPPLPANDAPPGQPGLRELKIVFPKPVLGRYVLQLRFERDRAADLAAWTLPPVAFPGVGVKSVRGFVGVAAVPGLRLSAAPAPAGLSEIAPAFFPRKVAGLQQAWRLRDPAWSATLRIERLDMAVQCDALHLFAVREGLVGASAMIHYAITGAPVSSFRFEVPAGLRNLEFSGRDIRSWKRDADIVEVSLHKPVSGACTLLGTYDLPLDPRGDSPAAFTGLRPLDVQSEQGFVIVTSALQFNVAHDTVSPNLVALETREIPAEYRMMYDAPLLAAYHYTERPFQLRLNLAPRPRGVTVSQVVDFASLQTRVARDGQVITEARYVVKSHGHPSLRVGVPAGLRLWTARVDDAETLPVVDGGDTLIPMPPRADANAIVTVDLRFAGDASAGISNLKSETPDSGGRARVRLTAPHLGAPVINTRWQVTPDQGRRLEFHGGNLSPVNAAAAVPEPVTGLRSLGRGLERRGGMAVALFTAIGLGGAAAIVFALSRLIVRSGRSALGRAAAAIAALSSVAALLLLGVVLLRAVNTRPNPPPAAPLEFTAPIHPGDADLFLELAGIPADAAPGSSAAIVMIQWILIAAGLALFAAALLRRVRLLRPLAWTLLGLGALLSPDGISWFAALAALFIVGEILVPGLRGFRLPLPGAAMIGLGLFVSLFALPPPASARTAESMTQRIVIGDERAAATATLRVAGQAGDRFDLLAMPAVLTRCELPATVRLVRETRDAGVVLCAELLKSGAAAIEFAYEFPLAADARDFDLPTCVAAVDTSVVVLPGADRQIASAEAASITEEGNAARVVFLPQPRRNIGWKPRERDRHAEKLVFYAETADLYIPAPGVIDGRHRAVIRPAQGVLSELGFSIPAGLTVSNVGGANIGRWRFDPEERRLHVRLVTASASETTLLVETQTATGPLPQTTTLHPLTLVGAAGQVGLVGVATGDEVQILSATPARLLPVNVDDFPAGLLPSSSEASKSQSQAPDAPVLRRSYRHGGPAGASLVLKTVAVEPDVRVTGAYNLSLGEDRTVLSATLAADITRAGVFRLSFPLPSGFEVESLSGPALSHWTEVTETPAGRIIVMHLRGRTLGRQQFVVTFTGPGLARLKNWDAPRVHIREATRQTGEFYLVPEEGMRLHVSRRENVTQFDPARERLTGLQPSSAPPAGLSSRGSLAFRLLQADWRLSFEIETLAPWIQCFYLQDVTVRDRQLRGVASFDYTIENAAARALRVTLPADATGVRFTGPLVADAVAVSGEPGLWEIKLQRRALGKVFLQAAYQLPISAAGATVAEDIAAVRSADAGLQHGWLALRASGRLELKPGPLPAALQVTDWQSVPAVLRQGAPEPAAILRMVENVFTLPVAIATHDPARLLPVRVERADIVTMLSDEGVMLTQARLSVRLTEKRILRLTLPEGASYWHGFVNDEPVRVAADGGVLLLPVTPNPVEDRPSVVEFYYSAPTRGRSQNARTEEHLLNGPRFDVPLENITWRVRLPDGRLLAGHRSDLQYAGDGSSPHRAQGILSSISDYKSFNQKLLDQKEKEADKLIQLGNKFRQAGDQEKARQALSLANTLSKGNEALNEDARVQLNALRMEQIEVGMNRLRQSAVSNVGQQAFAAPEGQMQLTSQATLTGGTANYAPAEIAQLRSANTAEDNAVIRKVASRFLTQQQTMVGTLDSIRTTIPDSGDMLTFTRSLQVGTDNDLSMSLTLKPRTSTRADFPLWPLLIAGAILFVVAWMTSALLRDRAC